MTALITFCVGIGIGMLAGYLLSIYRATLLKKLADEISPPTGSPYK